MAGSIRLKREPNIWELRIFLGRDNRGRVRHKHVAFRGTRRQAELELARLVIAQTEKPAPVSEGPQRWGPSTTVNDAIQAWKDNGWEDLSPKTTRGYENTWRIHIEQSIGRERIASLGTYEVERYYRRLKAKGAKRPTVVQVRAVLHRSCRLARKWSGGLLPNPITDAELPVYTLAERSIPVRSPDLDEVIKLLGAARFEDPRFAGMIRVVASSGMRRGEVCALRWSDLDFEASTIVIDESIIASEGGASVKGPKTRASIRTIAVDDETMACLEQLRLLQTDLAEACELALEDDSFVFSFSPGGSEPPHPDSVSTAFTRIRTRAGVAKDVHLHSLRHFQATCLDPVISERQKQARLGWSTVQMARHYTDTISEEDRRAANYIGGLLPTSQGPMSDSPDDSGQVQSLSTTPEISITLSSSEIDI